MSFDIKDVGENITKTAKKYPWLAGGGLILVMAAVIYNKSQREYATITADSYPEYSDTTDDAVDQADQVTDALAGLDDYLNSSLADMGDVVTAALASNNDTINQALSEIAAASTRLSEAPINYTYPEPQQTVIEPIPEPVPVQPITVSPSRNDGPVPTSLWDWGYQNQIGVTYNRSNNTVTIGTKTFRPDAIPGTVYNPQTMKNEIVNVNALAAAVGPNNGLSSRQTVITPAPQPVTNGSSRSNSSSGSKVIGKTKSGENVVSGSVATAGNSVKGSYNGKSGTWNNFGEFTAD